MKNLLTNSNRELAADGIFTWTLPALATQLSDGSNFLVCPNAGACAQLCYARSGTFNFSNVKKAHRQNLELILDDLDGWKRSMIEELVKNRFRPTKQPVPFYDLLTLDSLTEWQKDWATYGGKAVRIHDSGDFFSSDYFEAWLEIAKSIPFVFFYAYTKEVEMTKAYQLPKNFVLIYSLGGKQDSLIDLEKDRHAEVFPTMEALVEAGYTDQEDSDILAALMPSNKVGIVANNIKHLKKKQGSETFGSLQKARK